MTDNKVVKPKETSKTINKKTRFFSPIPEERLNHLPSLSIENDITISVKDQEAKIQEEKYYRGGSGSLFTDNTAIITICCSSGICDARGTYQLLKIYNFAQLYICNIAFF